MEEADLDVARATLLESLGRFAEAAEVHFAEGGTCAVLLWAILTAMYRSPNPGSQTPSE
jgi:hypothetical protein